MKVLLIHSCAVLLLCSPTGALVSRTQEGPNPSRIGDSSGLLISAPTFAVRDLQNRLHKTTELQGSIVVLDFWATWCQPCIGELASFNRLQEQYSGQGVRVIGMAVQSGWPKDIKRFAAKHSMHFLTLVGTDDTVSDFDVISFPTTFVIAPGWKIYKKYIGTYEGKASEIERDVQSLLSQKR